MENSQTSKISKSIIQEKLNMGYQVDIAFYLSTAWEIFKKEWLIFSIYSLIFLFSTSIAVGVLFIHPFTLGFFIGADRVAKGKELSLSHMFGAFGHKLKDLILLVLIPIAIIIIMYFPLLIIFSFFGDTSNEGSAIFILLLSVISILLIFFGIIVLNLSLLFAPYLVWRLYSNRSNENIF